MEHTTLIEHRLTRTDSVQVNVISFAHLVSKQRQINPKALSKLSDSSPITLTLRKLEKNHKEKDRVVFA